MKTWVADNKQKERRTPRSKYSTYQPLRARNRSGIGPFAVFWVCALFCWPNLGLWVKVRTEKSFLLDLQFIYIYSERLLTHSLLFTRCLHINQQIPKSQYTEIPFTPCWPRPHINLWSPKAQWAGGLCAASPFTPCWPRLHMICEAPKAQWAGGLYTVSPFIPCWPRPHMK